MSADFDENSVVHLPGRFHPLDEMGYIARADHPGFDLEWNLSVSTRNLAGNSQTGTHCCFVLWRH